MTGKKDRAVWTGAGARLAVGLVALLAAGCGEEETGYFPLQEGWRWTYRVTTDISGIGAATSRSIVVNLPALTLEGERVVPRLGHDGSVYYYAAKPDGIRRVAFAAPGHDLTPAAPDLYVLKNPIEVGSRWRIASHSYLLKQQIFRVERVGTTDIVGRVALDYTIEKIDDVVSVPAGRFTDAVRVRGTGETTYDLGHPFETITITVESTEWFAPGVGLVKTVRRERAQPKGRPESLFSGEMVKELVALDRGGWFE